MKKIGFQEVSDKNIWITADLHFAHENIIRYSKRNYNSIIEMNIDLIKRWNEKVKKNDIVFIVGDFCFGNKSAWVYFLSKLNGKKTLVIGNHDKDIPDKGIYLKDIEDIITIKSGDFTFILTHYPLLTWAGRNKNTFNLHGHVHTTKEGITGYDSELTFSDKHYDVGVDNNDMYPISLEEIKNKLAKKQ